MIMGRNGNHRDVPASFSWRPSRTTITLLRNIDQTQKETITMPWNQVPKQERPPRPPRINVPTVRVKRPKLPPKPQKPPEIEGYVWRWQ